MPAHPLVRKLCWALVIGGTIAWLMIPAIFFLPLDAAAKAGWAGGVFVASEVAFWAGALVLGPRVLHDMWARFKPQPRRKLPSAD